MVSQDSKVTWGLKVTGVKLVPLVHEVKMGLKVPKAVEAPMVTLVLWVPREKRGNLEFQVCQVIQEE